MFTQEAIKTRKLNINKVVAIDIRVTSVVINDENQAVEHANIIKDTIWAIEALALLVDDAGQIII